ncbi:MAG: thioredoxin domain-containing protein [Chloroflexi bacterium]|nr:thioredoxin domain-containing protein [Chloroflexota bacterium]MDA1145406.1 thioredoxin domain-containing protein [Chloroflexota bacterium]
MPDTSEDQPAPEARNRLARETSPYLLQHADNPVDWYPWGDEAFDRARAEGKPILLSVGYSACHWCHVMAHESFENEAIAAQMNRDFVNIKVDREERPDVDSVYMTFTQAMTGQGGWPMTVFLTPDLEPFYAGTYFPPEDGHGRPGFPRLLEGIRNAWDSDHDNVLTSAANVTAQIRERTTTPAGAASGDVPPELPARAAEAMRSVFDATWGGFGGAPKFPSPGNLEFLLMHHQRREGDTGTPSALEMVLHTLRQMWAGGMYDHLGGGFARYSVDAHWLVPHFEKMLYDNAQLIRVYVHAFQVTGDPFHERVVRETLAYIAREMTSPEGGWYAAQDADSEGIEGKFFVWTPDQIAAVLGPEDGAFFCRVFDVQPGGNFVDPHHQELTGRSVLSRPDSTEELAAEFGLEVGAFEARVDALRVRLFEARSGRIPPGLDDKVLTSWNGLMLGALAEAGRVLDDRAYIEAAERNAAFVRANLWRDGRLLHTYKSGVARVDGLLEDYAYYALGLVELYRATGNLAHLEWARELFEATLARFRDTPSEDGAADGDGSFFETPEDGEALLLRQKPVFDAPTPSGNGATALLAATLARYFGEPQWDRVAREVVSSTADRIAQAATGFGSMLQAAELLIAPHREIAIVGPEDARAPYERAFAARFLPAVTLATAATAGGIALLEDREPPSGASAAAFVCHDFVCELPTTSVEAFEAQLAVLSGSA